MKMKIAFISKYFKSLAISKQKDSPMETAINTMANFLHNEGILPKDIHLESIRGRCHLAIENIIATRLVLDGKRQVQRFTSDMEGVNIPVPEFHIRRQIDALELSNEEIDAGAIEFSNALNTSDHPFHADTIKQLKTIADPGFIDACKQDQEKFAQHLGEEFRFANMFPFFRL